MNNQIFEDSSPPRIVVTEPSPISDTTPNTVSVRKIESIPEVVANGAGGTPESVQVPLEQASTKAAETNVTVAATSEPSTSCGSEEFTPAAECNDCVVSVPEPRSTPSVDAATTSTETESEQEYFRTADERCCANCGLNCLDCYEYVWNQIHSGYAIPLWLGLIALPVSSGYMSALNMYSCQASHSLPMLMFTVSILLMAAWSLRVCIIIRRLTANGVDDFRNKLHNLLLISSFLSVIFFTTESVAFWKMSPSDPGLDEYCDPQFVNFSYWWNCVMSFVMVLILIFPA